KQINYGLSNNALSKMLGYMQQSGINIPNNVITYPTDDSYIHTDRIGQRAEREISPIRISAYCSDSGMEDR
ncbi:MAG: hypothetical protein AB7S65_06980, partial [Sulfuricurvum sp.]